MHDPFAMRPFFGYNFGDYIKHWLSFGEKDNLKLPQASLVLVLIRCSTVAGIAGIALSLFSFSECHLFQIFHVNWFRKQDGKFIWPGFGENSRVLEWIFDRTDNADNGNATPVGILPKPGKAMPRQ